MRIAVLLLCSIAAAAQLPYAQPQAATNAPALLELDGTQQRPVLLTPQQVIRAADDPIPQVGTAIQRAMYMQDRIYNGMVQVELSVVISVNGRVESAKPIRAARPLFLPQRPHDDDDGGFRAHGRLLARHLPCNARDGLRARMVPAGDGAPFSQRRPGRRGDRRRRRLSGRRLLHLVVVRARSTKLGLANRRKRL